MRSRCRNQWGDRITAQGEGRGRGSQLAIGTRGESWATTEVGEGAWSQVGAEKASVPRPSGDPHRSPSQ